MKPSSPAARRDWLLLWILVAVLVVTHVWPPTPADPPRLFGALPWDLAYPLLWVAAATAVVLFMTERVWRHDDDDDEGVDE